MFLPAPVVGGRILIAWTAEGCGLYISIGSLALALPVKIWFSFARDSKWEDSE
jgi:hypothetical protein